jgi:hypothetical protein
MIIDLKTSEDSVEKPLKTTKNHSEGTGQEFNTVFINIQLCLKLDKLITKIIWKNIHRKITRKTLPEQDLGSESKRLSKQQNLCN